MISKNKNKVHIIAEIGVNHNGDVALAKKLILESKKLGADSVKLQTFNTDEMIVPNTRKAKYQTINTKNAESQYEMLKRYEFSHKDY
jgi:sialic acid synthase SpsE